MSEDYDLKSMRDRYDQLYVDRVLALVLYDKLNTTKGDLFELKSLRSRLTEISGRIRTLEEVMNNLANDFGFEKIEPTDLSLSASIKRQNENNEVMNKLYMMMRQGSKN